MSLKLREVFGGLFMAISDPELTTKIIAVWLYEPHRNDAVYGTYNFGYFI